MNGQKETLLTVSEVKKHIGISQQMVYRLVDKGDLPVLRLVDKGMLRFRLDDVDAWIKSKEINSITNTTLNGNSTPKINNAPAINDCFTVKEASAFLESTPPYIRQLCRNGKLPTHRLSYVGIAGRGVGQIKRWRLYITKKDVKAYKKQMAYGLNRPMANGLNRPITNSKPSGECPDTLETDINQITEILNRASDSDKKFIKEWVKNA